MRVRGQEGRNEEDRRAKREGPARKNNTNEAPFCGMTFSGLLE
jgi:hypothetical protein